MKKVFQKNQMIIMTLAVVIAVAGYVNYSQKYDPAGTKNSKTKTVSKNVAKESAAAVTDDVTDVGEAVLTNAQVSNYVAKAKLEREQVHSKAKDTLEEIIKDQTVKDSVKQDAVDKLAMLSEQMEMETAAEAPIIAVISGEQSRSTLRTSQAMTTSLRRSVGKSGRMGRSIRREARTAGRLGLPSRRMKLPGMRPTA